MNTNHLQCRCRLKYHSPKLLQLFKAIFLFHAIHDGKDHMYFRESPCILFKLARYARASIICSNTRESMITRRVWLAPCIAYSILWYVWVYVCMYMHMNTSLSPFPLCPSLRVFTSSKRYVRMRAFMLTRSYVYAYNCMYVCAIIASRSYGTGIRFGFGPRSMYRSLTVECHQGPCYARFLLKNPASSFLKSPEFPT